MKHFKFLIVLAVAFTVFSCGSDDDGVAEPTLTLEAFAGTYNLNFLNSTEVITTNVTGGSVTTTISNVGDTFGVSNYVFNVNGTFTNSLQYRNVMTTTLENNEPVVETSIINENITGSYTLNNATQKVTIDNIEYDVTLFNNTNLTLMSENTVVNGEETKVSTEEIRFTRE